MDEKIFLLTFLCETLSHTLDCSQVSLDFQSLRECFLGNMSLAIFVYLRMFDILKCKIKSQFRNKLMECFK